MKTRSQSPHAPVTAPPVLQRRPLFPTRPFAPPGALVGSVPQEAPAAPGALGAGYHFADIPVRGAGSTPPTAVQRTTPGAADLAAPGPSSAPPLAVRPHHTGLPERLKTGIEALSGLALDAVRVHYHSAKPAQLQALAYTQGTDIHIAPGQEQHLPHEAWHVVQQAQGRVPPTMQMQAGVTINDDRGLEREADGMGEQAMQLPAPDESSAHLRPAAYQANSAQPKGLKQVTKNNAAGSPIQRRVGFEFETGAFIYRTDRRYNELVADEAEIFDGNGWTLVSDSGRMEFVSDPVDNLVAFGPIVTDITNFINTSTVPLNTDIRALNGANWRPAAVGVSPHTVKTSNDELNTVAVNAQTYYGHPQVSIGTKMESLGKFLTAIRKAEPMKDLRRKLECRSTGRPAAKPTSPQDNTGEHRQDRKSTTRGVGEEDGLRVTKGRGAPRAACVQETRGSKGNGGGQAEITRPMATDDVLLVSAFPIPPGQQRIYQVHVPGHGTHRFP